ncbi:MAG: hypothetical protein WC479_05860 [Candidatus Izemoplasmatales bacterium]
MNYILKLPNSNFPTGHEYLLPMYPDYDYRTPSQSGRHDYRSPDNWVGYQQRAFMVWWAIERCGKTGKVGLDIGSYGIMTPYCLSTDKFMTTAHPDYNGGECVPQLKMSGEDMSIIGDGTIPLIIGNHVLEHLEGDVTQILRQQWLPKLEKGGIIAQVIPDNAYGDVLKMDASHKQAWSAQDFELEVLRPLRDLVEVIEFDTFSNNFSFNIVVRKK